jgi:hypothetical protein
MKKPGRPSVSSSNARKLKNSSIRKRQLRANRSNSITNAIRTANTQRMAEFRAALTPGTLSGIREANAYQHRERRRSISQDENETRLRNENSPESYLVYLESIKNVIPGSKPSPMIDHPFVKSELKEFTTSLFAYNAAKCSICLETWPTGNLNWNLENSVCKHCLD